MRFNLSIVALVNWIIIFVSASGWARLNNDLPSKGIDESIGIVEWQFPTSESQWSTLQTHARQQLFRETVGLGSAFFPNLSEANVDIATPQLEKYIQHANNVYNSYVAGRSDFPRPFLLNFSDATPNAIQSLINAGVRIFSFSSVTRDFEWTALEDVIKTSPEVL